MKIKIETEKQTSRADEPKWILTDAAKIAIRTALDEVNGAATAFTVCNASDVYALSRRAESYMQEKNVPESERAGATVTFRPAGPVAGAYKYNAVSTDVTLARTGSGWYVTGVERAKVYPRSPERFAVTLSDRAIKNLMRRTLKAFGRVPEQIFQSMAA